MNGERHASSLVLVLKGLAAEVQQKVPSDSQNIYAELIKALVLRYGDKTFVRCVLHSVESKATPVSYTHLDVYKRQALGNTVLIGEKRRRRKESVRSFMYLQKFQKTYHKIIISLYEQVHYTLLREYDWRLIIQL